MEKGKQVVIVEEEPKALRVGSDKNILQAYLDALLESSLEDQAFHIYKFKDYIFYLGQFLRYFGESPFMVPGMKRVCVDLILLQSFLIDLAHQFVRYSRLMREIDYLAQKAAKIIKKYDLKKVNQHEKAIELGKMLDCHLKLMSHWMDLIRIIYGKQPKVSPPVHFVDYLAPLDTLVEWLRQFPLRLGINVERLLFLRAILTDPPQEFNEVDDSRLKELEFIVREVGFTISSIDLNNMDQYMSEQMCDRLSYIIAGSRHLSWSLEHKVKQIYAKRPKPSRSYYPKTGQLDFVELLADNLGELLVKAKADPSIRFFESDILWLQRKLQEVSRPLMGIPEWRKEVADMKDVITNIANLAYEAEYVIDSFLVGGIIPICYSMLWLRDILQELEHQQELMLMGFGDVNSILNHILDMSSSELQLISIFNNNTEIGDTLSEIFNQMHDLHDVRTRSLVSSYKERKKEVFLDLLRNAEIDGFFSDEIEYKSDMRDFTKKRESDMSEAELEESVFSLLEGKSYFVILEDVPDIYVLDDIKRVLPGNLSNSKTILLTTPSSELVFQCLNGFDHMSEHHPSMSQIDKPTIKNDVVGFVEETKKMLEQLIRGPKKLQIISIVGTAGQGKTTLAKKLFSDPLVREYFDTRAWCCVSQLYEMRQLLLKLLCQVVQLSNTDQHKDDAKLAEMLYQHLKGRRFLIFLDDIWEIGAWNDLRRCFTDDNNGSRIMLTTRIHGLASQAKSDSIVQSLSLLSDNESWELLEKKLFQKESCPIELLGVGRQIAKNCKGLPLSLVLTAGVLAKMEKRVNQWKQIVKSLSSLILGDVEAQGKAIIELSYKHLPDHLKSCFLYFGAFFEDKEVLVSKLIRLWIAEGFVKHTDLKSLEDVAEDYFKDLMGRSLVTITQEKSNGGVKSCHVHDLLREFCLIKAKEENFLQKIDGYDQDTDACDSSSSTGEKCHLRRLCMHPRRNHFTMLNPSGPFVRSLLLFAANDMGQSYSYDISSIFHNFKFLRTLNLEGVNIGDSFKEIGTLILLRYLACQSYVDLIPSSIANLWNLQTFLFKGLGPKIVKVSDSIWDMTKLRHLHISNSASFELDPDRLVNSFILDSLQTFSTPSLANGDDMEKIMRKLKGIRKLKCIFLDSWNGATNCNQFPELGYLSQLVSLNVFYNGKGKYPCQFKFPSNLKKLTLSNFRMPWNEISQLAELRELEVLKLLGNAFEGETWGMEDEVFPKLKFLKLDSLNIIEWNAPGDHFPHLECLILHKCEQLEEIPPKIGEIATLQMIEVMWCSRSTANSVKTIQEEQLEFGNEGLKIHVHPNVWGMEPSS